MTIDTAGRRITGIEPREVDQGQHDGDDDTLAVSSPGMLIRRDVWEKTGGFDPAMTLFREDTDLCWRVHAAGFRVRVITDAVMYHVEATARRRRSVSVTRHPARLNRANALITLLGNLPARQAAVSLAGNLGVSLLRTMFFLVAKRPRAALDEMAALGMVFGHPLRLLRARRRRAPGRRAAYARLRADLPPGRSLRVLAEWVASALSKSTERGTSGSHHASEDPSDDDSLLIDSGLTQRILTSPAVLLFAALTVISLVAGRSLLSGGPLGGGALTPAAGGASGLWHTYLQTFHPLGTGSATTAPPYLAVVAALATVLGGKPWLAVDVLLLGCVPLAGMTAYYAARRVTRSALARVWAAAAYALLPVALGAVAGGRIGTAAVVILLPLVALAAARIFTQPPKLARRAAWAAGLRRRGVRRVRTADLGDRGRRRGRRGGHHRPEPRLAGQPGHHRGGAAGAPVPLDDPGRHPAGPAAARGRHPGPRAGHARAARPVAGAAQPRRPGPARVLGDRRDPDRRAGGTAGRPEPPGHPGRLGSGAGRPGRRGGRQPGGRGRAGRHRPAARLAGPRAGGRRDRPAGGRALRRRRRARAAAPRPGRFVLAAWPGPGAGRRAAAGGLLGADPGGRVLGDQRRGRAADRGAPAGRARAGRGVLEQRAAAAHAGAARGRRPHQLHRAARRRAVAGRARPGPGPGHRQGPGPGRGHPGRAQRRGRRRPGRRAGRLRHRLRADALAGQCGPGPADGRRGRAAAGQLAAGLRVHPGLRAVAAGPDPGPGPGRPAGRHDHRAAVRPAGRQRRYRPAGRRDAGTGRAVRRLERQPERPRADRRPVPGGRLGPGVPAAARRRDDHHFPARHRAGRRAAGRAPAADRGRHAGPARDRRGRRGARRGPWPPPGRGPGDQRPRPGRPGPAGPGPGRRPRGRESGGQRCHNLSRHCLSRHCAVRYWPGRCRRRPGRWIPRPWPALPSSARPVPAQAAAAGSRAAGGRAAAKGRGRAKGRPGLPGRRAGRGRGDGRGAAPDTPDAAPQGQPGRHGAVPGQPGAGPDGAPGQPGSHRGQPAPAGAGAWAAPPRAAAWPDNQQGAGAAGYPPRGNPEQAGPDYGPHGRERRGPRPARARERAGYPDYGIEYGPGQSQPPRGRRAAGPRPGEPVPGQPSPGQYGPGQYGQGQHGARAGQYGAGSVRRRVSTARVSTAQASARASLSTAGQYGQPQPRAASARARPARPPGPASPVTTPAASRATARTATMATTRATRPGPRTAPAATVPRRPATAREPFISLATSPPERPADEPAGYRDRRRLPRRPEQRLALAAARLPAPWRRFALQPARREPLVRGQPVGRRQRAHRRRPRPGQRLAWPARRDHGWDPPSPSGRPPAPASPSAWPDTPAQAWPGGDQEATSHWPAADEEQGDDRW